MPVDFHNFPLLDRIRQLDHVDEGVLESLKFELEQHLYYYGCHFKYPRERTAFRAGWLDANRCMEWLRYMRLLGKSLLRGRTRLACEPARILSNAYFSVNDELDKSGFAVYAPPWTIDTGYPPLFDLPCLRGCAAVKRQLAFSAFRELIGPSFCQDVKHLEHALEAYITEHRFAALVVPNDIAFFENLSIRIFRKLGKPSFIFLHGLPGRYNVIDDNRSDYLMVWGERIKENYVKTGFDPDKILVSGHPFYKMHVKQQLRFDLGSVLVMTKAMNGAQHSDSIRLSDRGNLILYLYAVESVLKKVGVGSARLRPHPNENGRWYQQFMDPEFYRLDQDDLRTSLNRSTVVIGPTSTLFLETLFHGVNYVCYEPLSMNLDLFHFPLVPPFDGSDERVPVATDEGQLEKMLRDRIRVRSDVLDDYIKTPFDISFMKKIVAP